MNRRLANEKLLFPLVQDVKTANLSDALAKARLVQDSQVLAVEPCCRRIPKITLLDFILLVGQVFFPVSFLPERRLGQDMGWKFLLGTKVSASLGLQ
jgi:hypothetical protein